MKCSKCGFDNRQGGNFCERCGLQLLFEEPSSKNGEFCPQCGSHVPEGVRFCGSCGNNIQVATQAVRQAGNISCGHCGFRNRPGLKYCENCGQVLSAPVQRAQTQSPKPVTKNNMPGCLAAVGIFMGLLGVGGLLFGLFSLSNIPADQQDSRSYSQSPSQDAGGSVPEPGVGAVPSPFANPGSGSVTEQSSTDGGVPFNPSNSTCNQSQLSMYVNPAQGSNGTEFTIFVAGAVDYAGKTLILYFKDPAGDYIDFQSSIEIGDDCSGQKTIASEKEDAPGLYTVLLNPGGSVNIATATFKLLQEKVDDTSMCAQNLDSIQMSISPIDGPSGTTFTISVTGVPEFRGRYLDIRFKDPDDAGVGEYTEIVSQMFIGQDCKGQVTYVSSIADRPGLWTAALIEYEFIASGRSVAWVDFTITGNGNTANQCTTEEYIRSGKDFTNLLNYWFGEIDFFWSQNFSQHFTYRFEGGGYYSPKLLINPSPTECDDGKGYSAQYLSNFNVVTGAMTVNEIRFDGPAFMDSYLEWKESVPLVVLAHEFGHVLQIQGGLVNPGDPAGAGKKAELQADCLTGVFIRYASDQGLVSPFLVEQAKGFHSESGDIEGTKIPHGTSEERQFALNLGINQGINACLVTYQP